MATRVILSRSSPLLKQASHHHLPHFTPKQFPKSLPCPLWSSSFSSCLSLSPLPVSASSSSRRRRRPHPPRRDFSMAADQSLASNPLLQDFHFPPFDAVDASHVRPAIQSLLKKLESNLEELERTVEPTWPKLVVPLEKIVDRLSVVWGIVNHLKSVKDSPKLRAAIEQVQPDKVKFYLRLGQSKPIYNAFKAIKESPDFETLSDAQKRIVESQIKDAVLSGVALEDDKRESFNKIEQELEKLSQKFGENVLDATKKFEKLINVFKVENESEGDMVKPHDAIASLGESDRFFK